MNKNVLPILAVTLGDVAGFGPDVTAKMLLKHDKLREKARFVVIGDVASLKKAARQIGVDESQVVEVQRPAEIHNNPGTIEVIQVGPSLAEVQLATLDARAGASAAEFVMKACALARDGEVDGIVTAPLNKEAMHMGGYDWPGHTELLAHEFGVENFSLVLTSGDLFVFLATTHVSMKQAVEDCTAERVDEIFNLVHAFSKALGREGEAIAVAGLNPHAGENNLFGTEESEIIVPAINRARERGINMHGPLPGDVIWPQTVRDKRWKFLVMCYHDQGHAPFKAEYGDQGVNITVGLPVVRVSVDHGTAFDIAGKNFAREDSLIMAAERAAELAVGWAAVWEAARQNA